MTSLAEAIFTTTAWLRSEPANHAPGFLAVDDAGESVTTLDPAACSFCAFGYVAKLVGLDLKDTGQIIDFYGVIEGTPEYQLAEDILVFNDTSELKLAADALEQWGSLVVTGTAG